MDQTSNLDFAASTGLAPLSSPLIVAHSPNALPLVETVDSGESFSGVSTEFVFEPSSATSLRNLRQNGESSGIQSVELLSMGVSSDLRPDVCLEKGESDGDESDGQKLSLSGEREGPPSKRLRSDENLGRVSPPDDTTLGRDSSPGGRVPDAVVMVSRRERSALIKKFKQEQKVERRRYKSMVRLEWEEEIAKGIAEGKENLPQEGDVVGSSSASSNRQHPVDPETMVEAYEDYLFDRVMRHDGDSSPVGSFPRIIARSSRTEHPRRDGCFFFIATGPDK